MILMAGDQRGKICSAGGIEFDVIAGIEIDFWRIAGDAGSRCEIDVGECRFSAAVLAEHPHF